MNDLLAKAAPKRWPTTLLGLFGAGVVFAFSPGDAVRALALAGLAGLVLSLAVRGVLRQVVGGLVALIGVGMVVVGWSDLRQALCGFIVAAVGVVLVAVSPTWVQAAPNYERKASGAATPRDIWLGQDDGDDPTDDAKPVA